MFRGDNLAAVPVLVPSALCSTPARSCSEELVLHPSSLTAPATPVDATHTSVKHPVADAAEARARKGDVGAPLVAEPSSPVTAATATTLTNEGPRLRALSESDDPHGGTTWLDRDLPAAT